MTFNYLNDLVVWTVGHYFLIFLQIIMSYSMKPSSSKWSAPQQPTVKSFYPPILTYFYFTFPIQDLPMQDKLMI